MPAPKNNQHAKKENPKTLRIAARLGGEYAKRFEGMRSPGMNDREVIELLLDKIEAQN